MSSATRKTTVLRILTALVFTALLAGGAWVYQFLCKPNVPGTLQQDLIQIPSGADLEDVLSLLKEKNMILDESSFRFMADQMKYRGRSGQFRIKAGWSNRQLISHLRSGKQEPVRLVLVNERLPEQIAGKVSSYIEPDSLAILRLLNDPVYLDSIGYTPQSLLSLFIPNTYELYWNTSPRKFVERMILENERFWSRSNRLQKAEKLGMSPEEIYTLASIVERETNQNSEKKRIAGLYLNRLNRGMLLQADPTLVFASRDWETRSLAKYKTLDSPYNTYMYTGLPPGPIGMSSINSIDAVLEPEEHDYLFMCASGEESGLHNFAETLSGHNVNVKRYIQNLRRRGLY